MRLYVYVLEGQDLHAKNHCYVKLKVGKHKSKTRRVLKKPLNNTSLVWNEEFVFRVHDLGEEVVLSVFEDNDDDDYDDDNNDGHGHLGLFHGSDYLVGRVRIPVWSVLGEDNHTLSPTWFSLERPNKIGKHVNKDWGKILVTLSLQGTLNDFHNDNNYTESNSGVEIDEVQDDPDDDNTKFKRRKLPDGKHLIKSFAGRLEKLFHKKGETSKSDESCKVSSTESEYEDCVEDDESFSSPGFEEALRTIQCDQEMPEDLRGGVLIDQVYAVSPSELNRFLFAPDSRFSRNVAELHGSTDLHEGNWMWDSSGDTATKTKPRLTRVVSYTKAATKLVKAVKATEEQVYVKANGKEYAVLVSVSTPDVPYGNSFRVELLYKIMPGLSGEESESESSRLVISWGVNFIHSTMMRSVIEGGARQGLKESFDRFTTLLASNFKVIDSIPLDNKNQVISSLLDEQRSDWKLAIKYFCNFTVFATIFMVLYVIAHILLSEQIPIQGLEFFGLDLPDSFGELVTCGVLIIHLEHVYNMVLHFIQARLQRGGDHGIKSQGDGWVLTVALIEGVNVASLASSGLPDPYVVLTSNAKTRTSSVKLQSRDPQWNEILEFDAMEEPPSVLDVEVYNFDGPFDEDESLGHAEINFLKHTAMELADIWVPLEGRVAQSSQSKLHLRIFLDNTNGVATIREYLTKKEKEVGKKLNLRSPHSNSTFQKLFGLPPEEFLISDFTCQLKRKLPLQGRIFLSARIFGFYANLFGHKTKFFFLWEDIDDIQVLPPTLASVGSPLLVVILKKDRGLDARHGAKSQDEQGRLRFYFQSLVSFNVATRTIMALWRTRTLTPDQKAQLGELDPVNHEETDHILEFDYAKMTKVYDLELPLNVNVIMEMFGGGKLERLVMEKSGCLNYATTSWEPFNDDDDIILERRLSYKFNRRICVFGGDVTCMQRKSPIGNNDDQGWIVDEVMTLHNVPFSDHFRVQFRYRIEKSGITRNASKCEVFVGITWLKSTTFQQRISRNIVDKFTGRVREIFALVEREILLDLHRDNNVF